MSKLTVKNNAIHHEKHQKTADKIFPRNHSSKKCRWCFKYTMIKNVKINETCTVWMLALKISKVNNTHLL